MAYRCQVRLSFCKEPIDAGAFIDFMIEAENSDDAMILAERWSVDHGYGPVAPHEVDNSPMAILGGTMMTRRGWLFEEHGWSIPLKEKEDSFLVVFS